MDLTAYRFAFDASLPIVTLVDAMIGSAETSGASDIHIDPRAHDVRMRFRIDGVLHDVCSMPRAIHNEFVARVKIISGLRTDEKIVPQDGRLSVSDTLDARVTTVTSYYGESVVIRLLRRSVSPHTLAELGFSVSDAEKIFRAVHSRQGLILVTGPTGSGKTTTLYSTLALLADASVSIVTIEDPVEYAMPHARQIQVHHKRGVNFVNGLRSILRQDPDVIMVGEIRDHETAAIATSAALTGHLVLSTLHTNDAVSTIVRAIEMGIEPYLLAATLRLVVSQRLVRKLCQFCKMNTKLNEKELAVVRRYSDLSVESLVSMQVYCPKGCNTCSDTGYAGRVVVAESLLIDEAMGQMIVERQSSKLLRAAAVRSGMTPIGTRTIEKLLDGTTSFSEAIKILHE